jgi:hypothetical protein
MRVAVILAGVVLGLGGLFVAVLYVHHRLGVQRE